MKIIVTCGPSYEPIDQTRRITNFSTGKLGILLANTLAQAGWEVFCFKGENATCSDPLRGPQTEIFTTNEDLAARLERVAATEKVAAVFHAAALCDFRVAEVRDAAGKLITSKKFPTREGEMTLVLRPTLKVLPKLRGWFPGARLVGWKYELEGGREEAFARARRQIEETGVDACVLNGAAYGTGFAFCTPDRTFRACPDYAALCQFLTGWLGNPSRSEQG